jgi:hypothetical protein
MPGAASVVGTRGRRRRVQHNSLGSAEAMKPPRVRWNTTEARIERFVRLAQRLGLPVHGFEVRGRDVIVLTHPRENGTAASPPGADPIECWFRDNAAADGRLNVRPRKKQ